MSVDVAGKMPKTPRKRASSIISSKAGGEGGGKGRGREGGGMGVRKDLATCLLSAR